MSKIQCFKVPGTVSSMDFNSSHAFFAAGGKQTIKIIKFDTAKQYWFECRQTINKHKNASMAKVWVNELAWNKAGSDCIVCGTTSGFVFVYDVAQSTPKSVFSAKGHDGNIKNILWVPNSQYEFISSSCENEINIWDRRSSESNQAKKIQYPEQIKIRDIKFNPNDPNIFGVQCLSAIKIVDFRMETKQIVSEKIKDSQLQGYALQWDPHNKDHLASGLSKEIHIFQWDANTLTFQQSLSHYSLIKNFKWLACKKNYFGISGESPEKNICFYDLADKDRVSYMYGGNSKPIDCWMMDATENIIISASLFKEKSGLGASGLKPNGLIVAQYSDNYIDPNQTRFQRPLTFDNNSSLAFNLTIKDPEAPQQRKNSRRYRYSFPTLYLQQQEDSNNNFLTTKDQIIYFHTNYLFQGRNDTIAQTNAAISSKCNKKICAQFWKIIFIIAYPEDIKQLTLMSLYQAKIKTGIVFDDNRILFKSSFKLEQKKINVNSLIQHLADQNQLQTAVIAAIILLNKSPELISKVLFDQILTPYIEILRSLELYTIASQTLVFLAKFQKFSNINSQQATFKITCGWCKLSVTKDQCKCNLLCVLCKKRLNMKMVIWCKYCGHGGHALEYKDWFQKNKTCPHGCLHECFKKQDFY